MLYLNKLILISALFINATLLYASDDKTSNDNQLKDIELQISSAAEKKHQYNETIEELDGKQKTLKQDLSVLQKKIEQLKISIKKNIKSEFIMRNKSPLKMLLESNTEHTNLSNILFYKKINTYQATKISEYLKLISQQKNITAEIDKNLNNTLNLKNAAQQEISNLKAAYHERSKILQLNTSNNSALSEIKIKTKPKPNIPGNDKIVYNPLEKINNNQIYYIQKNRAIIHAEEGSKVFAIKSGEVVFCGWMRGYGIIIIIDHGENLMSLYGHNQTTFKKRGDLVNKGDVISLVGKSGGHEKPGLYFEVRKNGISVSLNKWLKLTG